MTHRKRFGLTALCLTGLATLMGNGPCSGGEETLQSACVGTPVADKIDHDSDGYEILSKDCHKDPATSAVCCSEGVRTGKRDPSKAWAKNPEDSLPPWTVPVPAR